MQHDKLRKKAKQKVQAKKAFYILSFIFAAISVILVVISLQFDDFVAFWIRFPILVLGLIMAVMYIAIFGLPFARFLSPEWEDEQISRELHRLYREDPPQLPSGQELSEEDRLELEELERLKAKWDYRSDDFV